MKNPTSERIQRGFHGAISQGHVGPKLRLSEGTRPAEQVFPAKGYPPQAHLRLV